MDERSHGDETAPPRPMNVEQIVKKAQSFDYNPLIPLKYWLRTAATLLKEASFHLSIVLYSPADVVLQAEIYEHEGNDQQTYLLLFRHAQLVLGSLSSHPDAREQENRFNLLQAEKEVQNSLAKLEVLKPRINKRYDRYEQLIRDRDARNASTNSTRKSYDKDPSTSNQPSKHVRFPSDPAVAGSTEALAAGDNKDLAVRLAHKEIKRRATARKATRQAGISEEEEQGRRTAGLWGNWEEAFTQDDQGMDRDTLSKQMQNVRLQVNGSTSETTRTWSKRPSFEAQTSPYYYPTVPEKSAYETWKPDPLLPSSAKGATSPGILKATKPPEIPPKDNRPPSYDVPQPPKLEKPLAFRDEPSSQPSITMPPQQVDLKPSTFTFKPSAYLENGSPLRTIFLPPDLRHRFLSLALPNTRANLETCGILCGTLISNALFISKLVIPDQESTSDTCETVNESSLFDFVDGEDLMVLGWIHTHPTQTCFMSSRDLHTHCGYQVMMPESIAIVCAPSKGKWGVFRLTDPPGMRSILDCTQTGLFHPHAESDIYTDALRPGHVFEAKGLEFEVVDLRPTR
ncbi:hypothetical protein MMC12_005763 [Toensbergia leucococca]|nr:hypothetical protein [Toensbergia leucococca]